MSTFTVRCDAFSRRRSSRYGMCSSMNSGSIVAVVGAPACLVRVRMCGCGPSVCMTFRRRGAVCGHRHARQFCGRPAGITLTAHTAHRRRGGERARVPLQRLRITK
eukprot:3211619-Prymnesium_polylepis.1